MRSLHRKLYIQVIIAIILGVICGYIFPEFSVKLKSLGDAFIAMINVLIAPIVFCTIVCGICSNDDMKHVSSIVTKALIYFTIMTAFSLVIGLVAVNIFRPGDGLNFNVNELDTSSIANYLTAGTSFDIFAKIIPKSFVSAFTSGEILQVLFVAILTAIGLSAMGPKGVPIVRGIEKLSQLTFKIISYVMYLAPIGAFGAMAFTVGKFGINTLSNLMGLVGLLYITSAFFIIFVLGVVLKFCGVNVFQFVRYLREEIFIVLGTGSSETVLPRLIDKMEKLGCPESAVSIVVPTGYSFNLDGTAIALSMVAMFIAQATNTSVSLTEQIALLAVLLVTSKGAAAVHGSAFIVLASTLSTMGNIPAAGLVIIIGVDRFLTGARATTNLIGNGVAAIVVSKWEGTFNVKKAQAQLKRTH